MRITRSQASKNSTEAGENAQNTADMVALGQSDHVDRSQPKPDHTNMNTQDQPMDQADEYSGPSQDYLAGPKCMCCGSHESRTCDRGENCGQCACDQYPTCSHTRGGGLARFSTADDNAPALRVFTTPAQPIPTITTPIRNQSANPSVTVDFSYLEQHQQAIPHRKVTKNTCLALMKGIYFEVEASENLPRYVNEHQQLMDTLTERLYEAVMRYFGFEGPLTMQQNTEVTRFVLAILFRSQEELRNVTARQLPSLTDAPSALMIHLESIVTVLWDVDRELRPATPTKCMQLAQALVRIAAMRWQRELVQEWIEGLTLSPADRAIRAMEIAERDDAAARPVYRRAGRPEGTVKSKKKTNATAKKTKSGTIPAQPVLRSPFTTPNGAPPAMTQPRSSPNPYGNVGSLQRPATFNPLRRQQFPGWQQGNFQQSMTQEQIGYVPGTQFCVPQQSQHTLTPSRRTPEQPNNAFRRHVEHANSLCISRAVWQPQRSSSLYVRLSDIDGGMYDPSNYPDFTPDNTDGANSFSQNLAFWPWQSDPFVDDDQDELEGRITGDGRLDLDEFHSYYDEHNFGAPGTNGAEVGEDEDLYGPPVEHLEDEPVVEERSVGQEQQIKEEESTDEDTIIVILSNRDGLQWRVQRQ